MKNKILLSIVIILLPIAVISFFNTETNFNLPETKQAPQEEEKHYTVKLQLSDKTEELDLEDYVVGVVAGEMPASFEMEALKAQAVASRTYVMYKKSLNQDYDVMATTADQVYLTQEQMQTKWHDEYSQYLEKIKQAVSATKNQVIKYNDEIIKSYYFAMSNGYTEDCANVFNETQDYLVSVESAGENTISPNTIQITTFSKNDFCQKLNLNCASIIIKDINYSSSGRINSLSINNQTFSGTQVRSLLGLRSTDFIIKVKDSEVEITTNGYGHGVGMSQYGANVMAKNGSNYQEILTHYYKNVTITKI